MAHLLRQMGTLFVHLIPHLVFVGDDLFQIIFDPRNVSLALNSCQIFAVNLYAVRHIPDLEEFFHLPVGLFDALQQILALLLQGSLLHFQFPQFFLLLIPGDEVFVSRQFGSQIIPNLLLLLLLFTDRSDLTVLLLQAIFFRPEGIPQSPDFLLGQIGFYPCQEVFIHAVFLQSIYSRSVGLCYFLQLLYPYLHVFERPLKVLIGTHILPQDIDVYLLFIQHIGIHEILDIINRPKRECFGDQAEKLILQSSKAVLHHRPRFFLRRAPLFDLLRVGGPELADGLWHISLEKKIIVQSHTIHQISHRLFLSLGRRIHHRPYDEVSVFLFLIKFQSNMRTDLSAALIRLILPACLAPDITGQPALAVLMCRFIEMIGRTGHHELDRIQKCGFPGAVLSGDQGRVFQIDDAVGKPMPVNQLHSRQFPHLLCLLSDISQAFHRHS